MCRMACRVDHITHAARGRSATRSTLEIWMSRATKSHAYDVLIWKHAPQYGPFLGENLFWIMHFRKTLSPWTQLVSHVVSILNSTPLGLLTLTLHLYKIMVLSKSTLWGERKIGLMRCLWVLKKFSRLIPVYIQFAPRRFRQSGLINGSTRVKYGDADGINRITSKRVNEWR